MDRLLPLLFVALVAACAAPQPLPGDRPPVELAGRTAGPARDCIPIIRTEAWRVSDSDRHALLYGRGRTIWASDLGPSCGFSPNDVLVTDVLSRYCRGDVVRSFDGMSRIPGPSCTLGPFVPYTR